MRSRTTAADARQRGDFVMGSISSCRRDFNRGRKLEPTCAQANLKRKHWDPSRNAAERCKDVFTRQLREVRVYTRSEQKSNVVVDMQPERAWY